jgi:carbonic anhydrase
MSDQAWKSAMDRLVAGNARFCADQPIGAGRDASRRESLVDFQQPSAVILTCVDSRVAPLLAFDAGLGELVVVRVAGNVANTSSIASIEFAVAYLGTRLIVVLGHESCAAISAAIEGIDAGKNLNHLLDQIAPAVEAAAERSVDAVARENSRHAASRLLRESSIIGDAVSAGEVKVVPAYYAIGSGAVTFDEV